MQVDYLTDQLAKLDEELADKSKLESAYEGSEKARVECEKNYKKLLEKNTQINEQVRSIVCWIVHSVFAGATLTKDACCDDFEEVSKSKGN